MVRVVTIADNQIAAKWRSQVGLVEGSLHDGWTWNHLVVVDATLQLQNGCIKKSSTLVTSCEYEGIDQTSENAALSVEIGVPLSCVVGGLLQSHDGLSTRIWL